jgi:hypothetical protein
MASPSFKPRSAITGDRGAVGLVEAGLEHIRQTEIAGDRLQLAPNLKGQVEVFQHIDAGDHGQGLALPIDRFQRFR